MWCCQLQIVMFETIFFAPDIKLRVRINILCYLYQKFNERFSLKKFLLYLSALYIE